MKNNKQLEWQEYHVIGDKYVYVAKASFTCGYLIVPEGLENYRVVFANNQTIGLCKYANDAKNVAQEHHDKDEELGWVA